MSASLFSRISTRLHYLQTLLPGRGHTSSQAASASAGENLVQAENAAALPAANVPRRGTRYFFQTSFRLGASGRSSSGQNDSNRSVFAFFRRSGRPSQSAPAPPPGQPEKSSRLNPHPANGRTHHPARARSTAIDAGQSSQGGSTTTETYSEIAAPRKPQQKNQSSSEDVKTSHAGSDEQTGMPDVTIGLSGVQEAAHGSAGQPALQSRRPVIPSTMPDASEAIADPRCHSPEASASSRADSERRPSPSRTLLRDIPEEALAVVRASQAGDGHRMFIDLPREPPAFPAAPESVRALAFSSPPTPGASEAAYLRWTNYNHSRKQLESPGESRSVVVESDRTPSAGASRGVRSKRSSYFYVPEPAASNMPSTGSENSPPRTNTSHTTFSINRPNAEAAYASVEEQPIPRRPPAGEVEISPHSDDEIDKRLKEFDAAYQGAGITNASLEKLRRFYLRLIKSNPTVILLSEKPRSGGAATYALRFGEHESDRLPLELSRADASPLVFARIQADLVEWERNHKPDNAKILAAYERMIQAQTGKTSNMPSKMRRQLLSQAEAEMLEGMGIDKATWKRARRRIGMQGMIDIYDGFLHLAITTSVLAAISTTLGPVIPEEIAKATKYISTCISNVVLNALSQIGLDSIQDGLALRDGMPAADKDVANAPRLVDLRARMSGEINETNALLLSLRAALSAEDAGEHELNIEALARELDFHLAKLEKLQLEYRRRIATGQTFVKKYSTQLPFQLISTPAIVVANVMGSPLAGLAAAGGSMMARTFFAKIDEEIKNVHIVRSNLKYADYVAIDPETHQPVVDEIKVRSMWSHPVDVLQNSVALVYTEKLAEYHNEIRKLKKRLLSSSAGKKQEKLDLLIAEKEKKVASLVEDIGWFRAGIEGIREGRHGAEFTKLSPQGVIGRMLRKSSAFAWELTKARSKIPLEIVVQAVDRAAGLATTRTMGFIGVDGASLSKEMPTPLEAGSIGQVGVYASFSWTNIIAKWNKVKINRPETRPVRQANSPEDRSEITRKARVGRRQFFGHGLTPYYAIPIAGTDGFEMVDIQNTGAWYQATTSRGERIRTGAREFAGRTALTIANAIDTPVQTLRTRHVYKKTKQLNSEIMELVDELTLARRNQADSESGTPSPAGADPAPEHGPGMRMKPSAPGTLTGIPQSDAGAVAAVDTRPRSTQRPLSGTPSASAPASRTSTARQMVQRMSRQAHDWVSSENKKLSGLASSIAPKILDGTHALLPRARHSRGLPTIQEYAESREHLEPAPGGAHSARMPPRLSIDLDEKASIDLSGLFSEIPAEAKIPAMPDDKFLRKPLLELEELMAQRSRTATRGNADGT